MIYLCQPKRSTYNIPICIASIRSAGIHSIIFRIIFFSDILLLFCKYRYIYIFASFCFCCPFSSLCKTEICKSI
nr:MAG TPA: hypothetical protein [Bacteriophage sp.]